MFNRHIKILISLLFFLIESLNSSNRRIEQELLKTIQSYSLVDELSSRTEDHLKTCLQFIEKKLMIGSLSVYDGNIC